MAFGALSTRLLREMHEELIDTLLVNCLPKGKESDDAETRRQAVKSLITAVTTLGIHRISVQRLTNVITTLYKALDDYALDRRGDVGSWVREEAMKALTVLVQLLIQTSTEDSPEAKTIVENLGCDQPQFFETYVGSLLQQLAEKIDRIREVAGRQLQIFFKTYAADVCDFAERDRLTALFTQELKDIPLDGGALETHMHDQGIGYLPWRSADFVFDLLHQFFDSQTYSLAIFKGMVTSSGGLTESTLKAS